MKTKTVSAIVAFSSLLLVQGLDSTRSYKNDTVDYSRRIMNGERADPADFRFLVITTVAVGDMTLLCGGSVISNHFILTAAHCIYNKICDTIQISPSTWGPNDESDLHPIDCWPHELFDGHNYNNDIGILETEEDLLADGQFVKIDLPPPGTTYGPGDEGIVVGWGLIEDGSNAKYLMRAKLPVYSWAECNRAFAAAETCADSMVCPVEEIPDDVFCTLGKPPNFPGPCRGDSGGPVIINGMLAGVMSGIILTSTLQCEAGAPSLNQDVSKFVQWISDHIDGDRSHIPVANKYS